MKLVTLVALLSLTSFSLRLPLFEAVFSVLLLSPIIFQFFGVLFAAPTTTQYYLIVMGLFGIFFTLSKLSPAGASRSSNKDDLICLAVFCLSFICLRFLCHLWPDFISIGERLRDYALLNSVIDSPIDLKEPWMIGSRLNYYAYWYQFGHMLSSLLNMQTWEVYHELQSFTFALYITAGFRLCRTYLKFSWFGCSCACLLIAFGSNVAGLLAALRGDDYWWGPSRVIPGTINEFPAWSFLLGDLHPHYLNLPLIPFLTLLVLALREKCSKAADLVLLSIAALLVPCLWIYNSNVWEVPVWIGIILTYLALKIASQSVNQTIGELSAAFSWRDYCSLRNIVATALGVVVLYSLYHSFTQIVTAQYPFRLVKAPVARSTVFDLMRHFGLPLFIIGICIIASLEQKAAKLVGGSFLFALLFFREALPYLILIFVFNNYRVYRTLAVNRHSGIKTDLITLIIESFGIVSLGIVLGCEIIYLDDPYGAESERMNTIFKLYSSAWFPLHLSAFYLLKSTYLNVAPSRFLKLSKTLIQMAGVCCFVFFFWRTLHLRKSQKYSVAPYTQGLSIIDGEFPGAAQTIIDLKKKPKGSILEAQGNPYSYTTHIATLSGFPAYLGWVNHLNLLIRNHAEISRREKITEQFYRETDCLKKLEALKQENIQYVVVSPLEKKRYGEAASGNLECLKEVVNHKEYRVFSLPY